MAKVVENKKKVNGVLSYLVSRGKKRKWIRLKDFKEDDLPLIEMYELKQHYDIKLKQTKKQEKKDKQEIKAIKKVIYNRESNNWDFEFNTGDTLTGDQIYIQQPRLLYSYCSKNNKLYIYEDVQDHYLQKQKQQQ